VILVDANLLVYAHVTSFEQHEGARAWLDSKLSGREPVGLPWPSLLSFVRLVSNPRIFEQPESISNAWKQARAWLACPPCWTPVPSGRHVEILDALLQRTGLRSNHVPDAHMAALAIEHDLLLCSTDGDFARFSGLRWQNPLDAQ
jgi:uncharacterized protein